MIYLKIYLIVINLVALAVMYKDKRAAKTHQWRVPELNIFLIAIALGSIGVLCGMYLFRHKTKHLKFVFFVPLILFAQIALFLKLTIL